MADGNGRLRRQRIGFRQKAMLKSVRKLLWFTVPERSCRAVVLR